jgi:hypothetical protein
MDLFLNLATLQIPYIAGKLNMLVESFVAAPHSKE